MILKKLLKFLNLTNYPKELKISGRKKLKTSDFLNTDKLYHGFSKKDLDEDNKLDLNTIRFPDFSCNWDRFSKPDHIHYRENGNRNDGCYSFTVEISRYKKIATPVHDPIKEPLENYSHAEIRQLKEDENILFEPPKNRKLKSKTLKSKRLEYRQNIINNLLIEIEPK
ncbi:MAG: hypothetical protein GY754_40690 [bacterium]|nr:hypothetical protein [bacterium]